MEASDASKGPAMHVEDAPPTGISAPAKLSLWQAFRKWPKVAGYCLALTTAILLWGYDMAMVGNLASLPEFQYILPVFQTFGPELILWSAGMTTACFTRRSGSSSPNG
jgi:hypothetical protein